MENVFEFEFPVGLNSAAVVALTFEVEDQMGMDITIVPNVMGNDAVDDESEDGMDLLTEYAKAIVIAALKNFAVANGVEVTETDFTEVFTEVE